MSADIKLAIQLADEIATLTARLNEIKDEIRAEVGIGNTDPEHLVRVERGRRFDAKLARQVIPLELLPEVCVAVVDRALAQARLTPALYEQCQAETTPRVIFL